MSFVMVGAAATAATIAAIKAIVAARKAKKAKARKEIEKAKLEEYKQQFMDLDTSNPYTNMENVMEDLTVDQRSAEFQKQQQQQSQANIMQQMRGAAGTTGVAALAQTMAKQGSLDAQRAAASIGQQERQNQMARAQEEARIQGMFRQGEIMRRQAEASKVKTLMGMKAADVAGEAKSQQMSEQAMYGSMDEMGQAAMAGGQAYAGGV